METNQITRSNKWRNEIKIKHLFADATSPELIVTLCDNLIKQLQKIKEKEEVGNLTDEEKDTIESNLQEAIDNFQFLKELANSSIPEDEWDDYSFNGDFESDFNDYLSQLYDIGDTRVVTTKNISEKFIFIN